MTEIDINQQELSIPVTVDESLYRVKDLVFSRQTDEPQLIEVNTPTNELITVYNHKHFVLIYKDAIVLALSNSEYYLKYYDIFNLIQTEEPDPVKKTGFFAAFSELVASQNLVTHLHTKPYTFTSSDDFFNKFIECKYGLAGVQLKHIESFFDK